MGATRFPGDPPGRSVALDMQNTPTTDELFDILTEGSRIPLAEVLKHHTGRVYEDPEALVLPRDPDCQGYLELGDDAMLLQLDETARGGTLAGDDEFPFRLIGRLQEDTLNSLGRDQPKVVRKRPHHPAHMHPADMEELGIEPGMLVAITSRRGTVHAVVMGSEDLRRGLVSMSHSYGIDLERLSADSDAGAPQPFSMGNHTGALVSADLDHE